MLFSSLNILPHAFEMLPFLCGSDRDIITSRGNFKQTNKKPSYLASTLHPNLIVQWVRAACAFSNIVGDLLA